jgi:hypothetical protein
MTATLFWQKIAGSVVLLKDFAAIGIPRLRQAQGRDFRKS